MHACLAAATTLTRKTSEGNFGGKFHWRLQKLVGKESSLSRLCLHRRRVRQLCSDSSSVLDTGELGRPLLRGVQWCIDLGILPSSSSIDDLCRVTTDSRRRYKWMFS
ncbi:uncharacterized protein LOC114280765 [Camellia sinensis]|uniref:uncharacterized protein LOC114280765 n=1 Tax=Camellia sinensis TaxID=4442 RepID=UPI00103619CB|nr:uncharacterized protein LOC114280765 [Camellia sinensis]